MGTYLDTRTSSASIYDNNIKPSNPISSGISNDAQAMLDSMSNEEIRREITDLEKSLNPETIAFLRRRGHSKADQRQGSSPKAASQVTKQEADVDQKLLLTEKERLAKLLAEVRTIADLDETYRAEMGDREFDEKDFRSGTDFEIAFTLLRSTDRRQRFWAAKTVAEQLQLDVKLGTAYPISSDSLESTEWPYPRLLPVSLRCLLDEPLNTAGGQFLLHASVLQAIYCLLRLRVHPDHLIRIDDCENDCSSIYQQYIDDKVPASWFSNSYPSVDVKALATSDFMSAYATGSSSETAQADSEAFLRDPLWTLTSKMKVIPGLARLLRHRLPDDAVVSICGILASVALHNRGAATAIAQHKELLSSLLEQVAGNTGDSMRLIVAIPTVRLLITLARQSRAAAESLRVEELILRFLMIPSNGRLDFVLQQWALILWRTLLRYGLCLTLFPTLVSLAARSISLATKPPSLAPEFFSAFAAFADCAKCASVELSRELSLPALSSLARQATDILGRLKLEDVQQADAKETLHLYTSLLLFLEAMVDCSTSGLLFKESKSDIDDKRVVALASSIMSTVEQTAFASHVRTCMSMENSRMSSLSGEASTCGFLSAVFSAAWTVYSYSRPNNVSVTKPVIVPQLFSCLAESLMASLYAAELPGAIFCNNRTRALPCARVGWRKAAYFSMVRFVIGTKMVGIETRRALVFSCLESLDVGDESCAVALFCDDEILTPNRNPAALLERPGSLSTFFVREFCRSDVTQRQLEHSFKLHGGMEFFSIGTGPLELQTLLPELFLSRGQSSRHETGLLPLDTMWLWQVLAGSVHSSDPLKGSADVGDAKNVVENCLNLLIEIEESSDALLRNYCDSRSTGSKLYFLLNVCLHPESVFEGVQPVMLFLLDRYSEVVDFANDFTHACYLHSIKDSASVSMHNENSSTEDEENLLKTLRSNELNSARVLDDFVGDMCEAFVDYGAQYAFIAKSIRLFLLPGFSVNVRCEVVRRLKGLTHLLTLEDDNVALMLEQYISGGLPAVDGSSKDPPEILEVLSGVYWNESSRVDGGLVCTLAVALLARNLVVSLGGDESQFSIARRRINGLPIEMSRRVLFTAFTFLMRGGTRNSLVAAAARASCGAMDDDRARLVSTIPIDWDTVSGSLRGVIIDIEKGT